MTNEMLNAITRRYNLILDDLPDIKAETRLDVHEFRTAFVSMRFATKSLYRSAMHVAKTIIHG